ncbi:MAG: hypothetical protein ABH950_05130 [Candidatus Altiarchaeota archaeon]
MNVEASNNEGDFQGAYQLRDSRIVIFRSIPGSEGSLVVNSVENGLEQSTGEIVAAFEVDLEREKILGKKGREIEVAEFSLPEVRGGKELDYKGAGHYMIPEGTDSYVGHGIASLAFDKLEANESARGASFMRIETDREDVKALVEDRGYKINAELTKELDTENCFILEKKLDKAKSTANMGLHHSFTVVKNGKKMDVFIPIIKELDNPPEAIGEYLEGTGLDWYRHYADLDPKEVDPYFVKMAQLEGGSILIGGACIVSLMLGKARPYRGGATELNYVGRKAVFDEQLRGWHEHENIEIPPFRDRKEKVTIEKVAVNPESSISLRFYVENALAGKISVKISRL